MAAAGPVGPQPLRTPVGGWKSATMALSVAPALLAALPSPTCAKAPNMPDISLSCWDALIDPEDRLIMGERSEHRVTRIDE